MQNWISTIRFYSYRWLSALCLPLCLTLFLAPLAVHGGTPSAVKVEVSGIRNFVQYDSQFASAGQPTAEQLTELAGAGFKRVVYIAFSDHKGSLAAEDRLVKKLGMDYLQLPVDWNAPRYSEFATFAASMETSVATKTLLHCQMNYRASAFALLYRVIYQSVPLGQAKKDMNDVWTPDATWTAFILDTLKRHNIDANDAAQCNNCDWTAEQH